MKVRFGETPKPTRETRAFPGPEATADYAFLETGSAASLVAVGGAGSSRGAATAGDGAGCSPPSLGTAGATTASDVAVFSPVAADFSSAAAGFSSASAAVAGALARGRSRVPSLNSMT